MKHLKSRFLDRAVQSQLANLGKTATPHFINNGRLINDNLLPYLLIFIKNSRCRGAFPLESFLLRQ